MANESVVAHGRAPATITALTGLRFAAAVLVVVSHFPTMVPIPALRHGLVEQGAAGVTIFFVLSGFVLTYRYRSTFAAGVGGARSFWRDRLARIVPMAVVAMLLTTAIVYAASVPSAERTARSWVINVLLLQAWVPTKENFLWNGPAWSISAELFFYAMFPLLTWLVVARIRTRHLARFAALFWVVEAVLFVALAVAVERRFGAGKTTDDIDLMLQRFKSFPVLRVWEFLIGCLLGAAFLAEQRGERTPFGFLARRRARHWALGAVAAALVALVVLPAVVDEPQAGLGARMLAPGMYVTYTPIALLLVAAVAWGPTIVSGVFDHPWMQRLGDASYSFYLLQGALLVVVFEWAGAPAPGFWFVVPLVLLLIPLSLLGEALVERPARALLRTRRPAPDSARAGVERPAVLGVPAGEVLADGGP